MKPERHHEKKRLGIALQGTVVLLCLAVAGVGQALITAPTVVQAGQPFTLTWNDFSPEINSFVRDSDGNIYTNSPTTVTKPLGSHSFKEEFCIFIPWPTPTNFCYPAGEHTLYAVPNPSVSPDSFSDQLLYEYQIRTGDFDGNGFVDILVDRLTPGSVDGSLQTTIINGTAAGVTTMSPNASQLANARSYPIDTNITYGGQDTNFDGYADILLDGLDSLLSPAYDYNCLILYAAGVTGSAVPKASFVDEDFMEFFSNMGSYFADPQFYNDNVLTTTRPVFQFYVSCPPRTSNDFVLTFCRIEVVFVGFETQVVGIAYNPDAKDASEALDDILNGAPGDPWKDLSEAMSTVIGVPSFGYLDNGQHVPPNTDTDIEDYDPVVVANRLLQRFLSGALRDYNSLTSILNPPQTWERHVYETGVPPGAGRSICSTTADTQISLPNPAGIGMPSMPEVFSIPASICTLENVFCWMKRRPAPRENGSMATVDDLDDSVLDGQNPIRTHMFDSEFTLVNETRTGHALHDPSQSPNCARFSSADDIVGTGTTPSRCSFVHREARLVGSDLRIFTRGEGFNPGNPDQTVLNEEVGLVIFNGVDSWVQRQMSQEGSCVDDT